MIKGMYSGITGLKANQTKLDVIGNNIANVGTTAFKSSSIRFTDSLYQNMTSASAPGYNLGGTNPSVVGLGVKVSAVTTNMTQGNLQNTGSNLDCAIDGDGFFMVATGPLPTGNEFGVTLDTLSHSIINGNGMGVNYTRDGSFSLDADGNLLSNSGYRILGYPLQETGLGISSVDYAANGNCNFVDANSPYGITAATDTLVPMKIPNKVAIAATRNTLDATGAPVRLAMTYTGSSTTTDKPDITINNADNTYVGDTDVTIKIFFNDKYQDTTVTPPMTTPRYVISINGSDAVAVADADTINIKMADGSTKTLSQLDIVLNNAPTDPATPADIQAAAKNSWQFTVNADGEKAIKNFNIEKNGVIKGVLQDGRVTVLGQLAMSTFKNTVGLQKLGNNLYNVSANSGEPIIRSSVGTEKDRSNEDAFGSCVNGVVEMSNVDLAEQFTEMIVASRAFQANSKIITTSDEILQELVQLKR